MPGENFDAEQAAMQVSQEVLRYMDGQMEKAKTATEREFLKDIPKAVGKASVGMEYPLKRYLSATGFHEMLKGLYEMGETGKEIE